MLCVSDLCQISFNWDDYRGDIRVRCVQGRHLQHPKATSFILDVEAREARPRCDNGVVRQIPG